MTNIYTCLLDATKCLEFEEENFMKLYLLPLIIFYEDLAHKNAFFNHHEPIICHFYFRHFLIVILINIK